MSMSKLLITLGLILLMTTPIAVAYAEESMSYDGNGTAVVSDSGAMSDKITFSMSGVTRLDAGMAYEGWLVNSDTEDKVSTGVLTVTPDGGISHSWTSPDGGNILEMYDMVAITVEPMPDDDPAPSGVFAFSDMVDGGAMEQIRGLVVGDDSTLYMLQSQIDAAMMKVAEAQAADSIDDLMAATEEASGMADGIAETAAAASAAAAEAMDASGKESVDMYAKKVMSSSGNVSSWVMAAKDDSAAVMAEENLDTAKTLLNIVNGKLMAAAYGVEATGMGGASDAYMQAQRMATFQLPPPVAIVTPVTGDMAVPAAMQLMLFVAVMLIIGGGAMLYRERRHGAKA